MLREEIRYRRELGRGAHLDDRKLMAPPDVILSILRALPRIDSFEVLRSMLRNPAAPAA